MPSWSGTEDSCTSSPPPRAGCSSRYGCHASATVSSTARLEVSRREPSDVADFVQHADVRVRRLREVLLDERALGRRDVGEHLERLVEMVHVLRGVELEKRSALRSVSIC